LPTKTTSWATIERECLQEALTVLVVFRQKNPKHNRVPASGLSWSYTWDTFPVLLSMSQPAFDRVQARLAATTVYVNVSMKGQSTVSAAVPLIPYTVFCLLTEEEEARQSIADEE